MISLPVYSGDTAFKQAYYFVVSLAAVFSIVTGGALRDDTKNGCEGD